MRHGPPDVIWKEILCSVGLNFSVSLSTSSMSLSLPISNSEKDSQEMASKAARINVKMEHFFILTQTRTVANPHTLLYYMDKTLQGMPIYENLLDLYYKFLY